MFVACLIIEKKYIYIYFIQGESLGDSGHFLRIRQWGGGGGGRHLQKRNHTIPSVEKRYMVVGNKKFGVVSHFIVRGSEGILPQNIFVFFYPLDCNSCIV